MAKKKDDKILHQTIFEMPKTTHTSSALSFPIKSGLRTLRHPKRESERVQRIAKGRGAYE